MFLENDTAVANQFSTYWGSFAASGTPQSLLSLELGQFADWPQYEGQAVNKENSKTQKQSNTQLVETDQFADDISWPNIYIHAPDSEGRYDYLEDICDFWDSLDIFTGDGIYTPMTTTSEVKVTTTPPLGGVKTTYNYNDQDTTTGGSRRFMPSFILFVSVALITYLNIY